MTSALQIAADSFAACLRMLLGGVRLRLSLRSRRKHKAWGASPRIRSHKRGVGARETGDSVKCLSPAVAGSGLLFGTYTWGFRPRLYAYACYRRLRSVIDEQLTSNESFWQSNPSGLEGSGAFRWLP